jgi:ketol-acid reductoisomerase
MKEMGFYYDKDSDLSVLNQKTIGVIGYGNQGRSQALNLADTAAAKELDVKIVVGNRGDAAAKQAVQDGFDVHQIEEVSEIADVLFVLIPDEVMPKVFNDVIRPKLKPGVVLNFGSGYCVTFGLLEVPSDADVVMVAPRMGGKEVRDLYVEGGGFPSFIAVEADRSGKAKELTLALASAIGCGRGGNSVAMEVTFKQETISDLLSEQFLAPLVSIAMRAKYELDVEAGVPPAAALMELYLSGEWATVFERMAEIGSVEQLPMHSPTSQYGQLSGADELSKGTEYLDYESVKAYGRKKLEDIVSGAFTERWAEVQENGYAELKSLFANARNSPMIAEEQKTLKRLGRI